MPSASEFSVSVLITSAAQVASLEASVSVSFSTALTITKKASQLFLTPASLSTIQEQLAISCHFSFTASLQSKPSAMSSKRHSQALEVQYSIVLSHKSIA